MRLLVRILALAALPFGSVVFGGPADAGCPEPGQGPPGCHTGPVPAEWGEPSWEHVTFVVVGRQKGHLPGRVGNQHVTQVDTWDEDSMINGVMRDWFCPAGAVAPVDPQEASPCRLKATFWIGYDYSYDGPGETLNWAPDLRYVNYRLPIVVTAADNGGTRADRGWVSLHLKANGAVTQSWYDGDFVDVFERDGAYVSGGHFMGKAWLAMDSVSVDTYFLYREYYPEG